MICCTTGLIVLIEYTNFHFFTILIQLEIAEIDIASRAVQNFYFTNDPIFRSCALELASTRILGFADTLEFVCGKMFPSDVGCD